MTRGLPPLVGIFAILVFGLNSRSADGPAEWPPKPIRIASGVSGHIHPAACVSLGGTIVVIFSQSDFKDLRLTRSTDQGQTWSDPVPFAETEKLSIYPGSLTTLGDGRIVHAWTTWYQNEKQEKSRFVQYSVSKDEGKTWSEAKSLAKNPNAESIIRHPIVEQPDGQWLFSLSDRTVIYDAKTGEEKPFAEKPHGLVPIVRTAKGTLVSATSQRSDNGGKSWAKMGPFPKIAENGWRFEMVALANGWLVASEVLGPGVGGERWQYVVSRDDGKSWDFDGAVEYYNPGRAIGGRACPRTVQLDKDTLGTIFYDVDAKQPGGPGVFFIKVPVARLAPAEMKKQTHTYKKVGKLEIKADVYRPADDRKRPVVVWIHGGALINGHREGILQRLKDAMLQSGFILVSIDYRLAPEARLPEVVADVEDALKWVHDKGPELFGADPNRVAVAGGSAGGYLTLTAGFRPKPRPVALVSFWGYGELVGPWYSEPSPHPRHNRIKVSKEEAYKQVSGEVVSDSRDRKGDGGAFYLYCRQTGSWPKAVSGWDPKQEAEKFAPFMPLKNVTRDYPPTLLIHGEADTDVPYEQSQLMAAELKRQGVKHRLIGIPKAEHGLDGGDKKQIDDAYEAAFVFLREFLAPK